MSGDVWYVRLAKDVLRRRNERVDDLMYPGKDTAEELAEVVMDLTKALKEADTALLLLLGGVGSSTPETGLKMLDKAIAAARLRTNAQESPEDKNG